MTDTTRALLRRILENVAERVADEREYLIELDSNIGDADFGATLHRGCQAALDAVESVDDPAPDAFVDAVGEALLEEMAGSSGIVFGMSLVQASTAIEEGVSAETVADFAETYRDSVAERGDVAVGAKTMYDAIVPVADALRAELETGSGDPLQMSANAVEAARRGALFASALRAKRGRASYTEWRSVGHPDPGAVGTYLLLDAIHRTLERHFAETRTHDFPDHL